MSKATEALRVAFCLARAAGVTHLTRNKSHERPLSEVCARKGRLTENTCIRVWTSDEVGEDEDGCYGDEETKDTPPPNQQLLLSLYEVSEKEQK